MALRVRGVKLALAVAAAVLAMTAAPFRRRRDGCPRSRYPRTASEAGGPHVVLDSEGNATAVWDRWNGTVTVVETAYQAGRRRMGRPGENRVRPRTGWGIRPRSQRRRMRLRSSSTATATMTVLWERYAWLLSILLIESVDRRCSVEAWTSPMEVGEDGSCIRPRTVDRRRLGRPRNRGVEAGRPERSMSCRFARTLGDMGSEPVQLSERRRLHPAGGDGEPPRQCDRGLDAPRRLAPTWSKALTGPKQGDWEVAHARLATGGRRG